MAIVKIPQSSRVLMSACRRYFEKFDEIARDESIVIFNAQGRYAPETDEQIYIVFETNGTDYVVKQWISEKEKQSFTYVRRT